VVLSWCTNWCLRCSCVPTSDALDKACIMLFNKELLTPGWGVYVAMICSCGIGEEYDNEEKWEVPTTI
jgi:hypothetical protein